MSDIVPELLEIIREKYSAGISKSDILTEVLELIGKHTVNYEHANKAAREVGDILSRVYQNYLTSDILPDGKMYYNIADRVVGTTMSEAYEYIADIAEQTQKVLNENAGIGMKAIRTDINEGRISGIINRLSGADSFDDIKWILDAPIKTFCLNIIDESVKANAEFQSKSGLCPKIIRKASHQCCEWCSRLAGTYSYPDNVPQDVYRRHENCRCVVEYDPGSGKRQNVHTKQWTTSTDTAKMETRKIIGLQTNGTTVTGVSQHAIQRMAERNVTAETVRDAILRPLQIKSVKYDEKGRPSFTIVGEKATITINPETGNIVTAHRTHNKLVKKLKRR